MLNGLFIIFTLKFYAKIVLYIDNKFGGILKWSIGKQLPR